jgi:hypothetical protein
MFLDLREAVAFHLLILGMPSPGSVAEQSSHLQNCIPSEDMRQGTTLVVPQIAHSDFPALAAA